MKTHFPKLETSTNPIQNSTKSVPCKLKKQLFFVSSIPLIKELSQTGAESSQDVRHEGGAGESAHPAGSEAQSSEMQDDIDMFNYQLRVKEKQIDPVVEAALSMADVDLVQVSVHRNAEDWKKEVDQSIMPSSSPIVCIDCATSRISVFHEFLKLADAFPAKSDIYIPVGPRIELLTALNDALTSRFPKRTVYVVMCSTSDQSQRTRAGFALIAPYDPATKVVASVDTSGCRAHASEGLRQVCCNRYCPWRPDRLTEDVEPRDADEEFAGEDVEKMNFQDSYDQGDT